MGNCRSTQDREAQQHSAEIDKQIKEDSRKFKKECKTLLLGMFHFFLSFVLFTFPCLSVTFHSRIPPPSDPSNLLFSSRNLIARRNRPLLALPLLYHALRSMFSRMLIVSPSGSSESGKFTIVKQMKIIHQDGFTREKPTSYRITIYRNLLESAKNILLAMRKINADCINPSNRVRQPILTPFCESGN